MKKDLLRRAFLKSLPVLAGYVLIGFGFGMVLRDAGFGFWWAVSMSLLIYAGSMQYVGVSLLTAPAGLLTTLLTTLMINARHLFYSISMIRRYQNTGVYKPYLIFSMISWGNSSLVILGQKTCPNGILTREKLKINRRIFPEFHKNPLCFRRKTV